MKIPLRYLLLGWLLFLWISCAVQPDAAIVKEVEQLIAEAQNLSTDPDQAVALTEKALDLSVIHRYSKGESASYNWLGVLNQRLNRYVMAENVLKKALIIRKNTRRKAMLQRFITIWQILGEARAESRQQ